MKLPVQIAWALFSTTICASPVQVDVNIHVDIPDVPNRGVNSAANRPLAIATTSSALPKVTLETEIIQASPDRKQPVGKLRFKEAQKIDSFLDEPPLNNGSNAVVCPQEQVGWFPFAGEWSSQLFNLTAKLDPKFENPITPDQYKPLSEVTPIASQSEECLVLDIFVPKALFDDQNRDLAPVIVSFHGGGFVFGSKTIFGSPEGILKVAGEKGPNYDVIVVSVNYRLGAFGWLGGNEFRGAGGFENAGLSDQKVALEWLSTHINAFGGSPYEITALGESAGASSILHHLTAYGFSRGSPPSRPAFSRAILQSPAFFPLTSQYQMNATYRAFLKAAKVKSFEELQSAKAEDLIKANREMVYNAAYGTFPFGPVVSEERNPTTYVQVPPALKLLTGAWLNYIPLIIANNRREEKLLEGYIKGIYPRMSNDSLKEFATLYPMSPKNALGQDKTEREKFLDGAAAFGDLGTDCNVWGLKKTAPSAETYQYFYRIYPGFHGQDVGATWYPEAGKGLTDLNVKAQSERLQRWISCFAKEGGPNCNQKPLDAKFNPIDSGAMWIGSGVPVPGEDQVHFMSKEQGGMPSDKICEFWNTAPYWEPDEDVAMAATRLLQVQNEGRTMEL